MSLHLFGEKPVPINHRTTVCIAKNQMASIRSLAVFLLLVLSALLSGCGFPTTGLKTTSLAGHPFVDLNEPYLVQKTLLRQFRQWQGTPYRYGGLNRNGVDCSGFVYLTFRTRFGIQLPRSTREQIETGRDVTGKRLEPGDLLFFSTGLFDRHVGIYLGNRSFIHASKDSGVIISSLNDRYWHSSFEEARRIR